MIAFPEVNHLFQQEAQRLYSPYVTQMVKVLALSNEARSRDLLDELEAYAKNQAPAYEQGVVLILCAVHYVKFWDYTRAEPLLMHALKITSRMKDFRNSALANYMLYYIYSAQDETANAYDYARHALRSFLECAIHLATEEDRQNECCYMVYARDIAFDLLSCPDPTSLLINEFILGEYSTFTNNMMDEITTLMGQKRVAEAKQKIVTLLETVRDSAKLKETAEALIFSARCYEKFGEITQTIRLLKLAGIHYLPASHEQAFSRWMLALYQLQIIDQYSQALKNMEQSITIVGDLCVESDHQNNIYHRLWYSAFQFGMRHVLEIKVPNRPGRGNGKSPARTTVEQKPLVPAGDSEQSANGHGAHDNIQVMVTVIVNGKNGCTTTQTAKNEN